MRKSRFSKEQIIRILKEHAAGLSASDVCRKHGISDATFYKWRSRFGGMEVSDARKLKALEDENRRLKKLLAESMLDVSTLKEMLGKNTDEERYRLAISATSDVIWDWRLADGHVVWNEALAARFGHLEGQTSAQWWLDHIHPDDRARIDASMLVQGSALSAPPNLRTRRCAPAVNRNGAIPSGSRGDLVIC